MKSPSDESKMEVIALGHDHWRIARDNAARARDYVERLLDHTGEYLVTNWFTVPDSCEEVCEGPMVSIGITDLALALQDLESYCEDKLIETLDEFKKVVGDKSPEILQERFHIKGDVDTLLNQLVEAQIVEQKKRIKKSKTLPIIGETKDYLDGSDDELIPFDQLPSLNEGEGYLFVAQMEREGKMVPMWKVIKSNLNEEVKLSLKQRPRETPDA